MPGPLGTGVSCTVTCLIQAVADRDWSVAGSLKWTGAEDIGRVFCNPSLPLTGPYSLRRSEQSYSTSPKDIQRSK